MPPAPIKPRNLRIDAAVTYSGLSRTFLFNALKDGRLIRRKVGKSLLIDVPSLDALIDGLPTN